MNVPPNSTATLTSKQAAASAWRPMRRGETLQGFFSLELPSGMIINDCALHERDGQRWVSTPARCWVSKGETKYERIIDFSTKAAREKFNQGALEAIVRLLTGEQL